MPKRVFWPLTLVVMGLIFMASNLGLLPIAFWNLWPLLFIVVGLGGLLTSDRTEWMYPERNNAIKRTSRKTARPRKRR